MNGRCENMENQLLTPLVFCSKCPEKDYLKDMYVIGNVLTRRSGNYSLGVSGYYSFTVNQVVRVMSSRPGRRPNSPPLMAKSAAPYLSISPKL